MGERLQPAFWGGLFIGVLSALPFVGAGNCCCCLWVVIGGALATYLRQQSMPVPVNAAEGALMGLMAGGIGGVIWVVLSIPVEMLMGPVQQRFVEWLMEANPDMPPELRDMMGRASEGGVIRAVQMMFNLVLSVVFGLLGGLLGVAIFRKTPPPPPPGTVDVLPPEPRV